LTALSRLLVAGLHAAAEHPQAHVLFRDLGVPPSEDAASPWHDAMVDACAELIQRAAEAGQIPAGDADERASILVAAARGLNALAVTGAAPHLVERAMRNLPALLR
jgi:hypothetical protein